MNEKQRRKYRRKNTIYLKNNPLDGAINISDFTFEEFKKLKTLAKNSIIFSDTAPINKENYYKDLFENCFSGKPEVYKFDSNNTDKDIDDFFDSI